MEIGPQVGKSLFTGLFICYTFGLLPDFGIIYATYSEDKAIDFTKKYIIKFMGSEKYKEVFKHISLKSDLDKTDQTKTAKTLRKTQIYTDTEFTIANELKGESFGTYKALGMEQGMHGRPANMFIIDDYVGKAEDVRSEIFRAKRKKWFGADMPSRLQGNDSILIALCTRWYYDDIIGQFHTGYHERLVPLCINQNWEIPELKVIKYRAEYRVSDDNDPLDLRTKEGDLLWEEHAVKYAWAKGEEESFEALYNCDPTNTDDTEKIKESDFGYWNANTLPSAGLITLVVDAGGTSNAKSDKTAIQVWYVCGIKKYLLKLYYLKIDILPLCDYVYELLTEHYPNYHECIIEHASGGITLCQYLKKTKQMRGIIKMWFNGREIDDTGKIQKSAQIKGTQANSKLERYLRILPEFRQPEKRVFLPEQPIEHQPEMVRQLTKFTGERGKKDDHADCTVYLLLRTKNNVVPFRKDYNNVIKVNGYTNNSMHGIKVL